MPQEKSWVWEHYHQDANKVNSTFFGVRCKYCTKNKLTKIIVAENEAISGGLVDAVWPTDILLSEGESGSSLNSDQH